MAKDKLNEQFFATADQLISEHAKKDGLQEDLDDSESKLDQLKEQVKKQEEIRDTCREAIRDNDRRCIRLIDELRMLREGKPRLPNLTPAEGVDRRDPAETHSIGELERFGVSASQIEKIKDSKLAKEYGIASVADLIRAIGEDAWWHKRVKGIGESATDKITMAITLYRQAHPIPDGDDRPKECRTCNEVYPDKDTKCPRCQSTSFVRVEPPSDEGNGEADPEEGEGEEETEDADAELVGA